MRSHKPSASHHPYHFHDRTNEHATNDATRDPASNETAGTADPISLYLKREALIEGRMTEGLHIWLNPAMVDTAKIAAARPAGWERGAFEKGLRTRLLLKSAEHDMVKKRNEFLARYRSSKQEPAKHREVLRRAVDRVKNLSAQVVVMDEAAMEERQREEEAKRTRQLRREYLLALRNSWLCLRPLSSFTMSYRCPVPFYPDPGQPDNPQQYHKTYLVTGLNVAQPGAYGSWSSANAQYTGVSDATVKSYKSWGGVQSAWSAGCERGEHAHLPQPVGDISARPQTPLSPAHCGPTPRHPPCSPSPTRSSLSPAHSPSPTAKSLLSSTPLSPSPRQSSRSSSHSSPSPTSKPRSSDSPSPAPLSPPPLPTHALRPASPLCVRVAGRMAYAVRGKGEGVILDDYEEARGIYHRLQNEGYSAALFSSPSLTGAVCWVEDFGVGGSSAEAARHRNWVLEEYTARQRRITGLHDDGNGGLTESESEISTDSEASH
ncbi:hypothetical protein B0H19DRAFT_1275362 [Mycena capillaripes]|nr:hypothetical protein B0H19DRAFT_1275362 [Mycena capillaripes]